MAASNLDLDMKCATPKGGVKDKSPIIFLHAMLCSKEIWINIPQNVADSTGRKVYTYDARNHGASPYTDESNFKFNVDDLFSVIEKIKAQDKETSDKVILVGHDMGGMTAIGAALRKPECFEKVIIVEMYAKRVPNYMIERTQDFVTEWTKCVQLLPKDTPKEEVTSLSVESLYKNLKFKEDAEKKSYQKGNFLYKKSDKGYDAHYNAGALVKALDELKTEPEEYQGTYNGPTYFFYGTASHYKIADEMKSMKAHFPNAVLIPFEDGSHFFIPDMPTRLAEEITNRVTQ